MATEEGAGRERRAPTEAVVSEEDVLVPLTVKEFVAGGVAGGVAKTAVAPSSGLRSSSRFSQHEGGPFLDLCAGSIAGGDDSFFHLTLLISLVKRLAYQVSGTSRLKLGGPSNSSHVYQGILDCVTNIYRQRLIRDLYCVLGCTSSDRIYTFMIR